MRISVAFLGSLAALTVALLAPLPASAETNQIWEACIGATSTPDERVKACSAVIDTKSETGNRLAGAYCNRGHGLTEKGELDAALADLNEAIKLYPTYVCAFTNRGRVYAFKRDFERAIADYSEAIRIAPTDARGWRNRGMIRLFKGDNKGGLQDYNRALQYDPSDAISWNNRGQAKVRLGDTKGAIADFRKALELRPDLPTTREALRGLGAAQ